MNTFWQAKVQNLFELYVILKMPGIIVLVDIAIVINFIKWVTSLKYRTKFVVILGKACYSQAVYAWMKAAPSPPLSSFLCTHEQNTKNLTHEKMNPSRSFIAPPPLTSLPPPPESCSTPPKQQEAAPLIYLGVAEQQQAAHFQLYVPQSIGHCTSGLSRIHVVPCFVCEQSSHFFGERENCGL